MRFKHISLPQILNAQVRLWAFQQHIHKQSNMLFKHKSMSPQPPQMSLWAMILMALFCVQPVFAQDKKDKLNSENVDVVKSFEARLLESNKINVQPQLPALDTTTQKQTYLVPARPLTVKYDAPKLRPIGMKTVKEEKPLNGFAKLGAGVPKSLWGEFGYYFQKNDQFDGKVWFRHHSQSAEKSVQNQKFMNNDFLLNGNYYVNQNVAVEGRIGYTADRVHFYGYDDDSLSRSSEAVRQDFKTIDISGRVYNKERNDADINYSVQPKFYTLSDYYSNDETGFSFDISATKWFAEKHPLRISIRPDLTKFSDTASQKLNNIYLQPSFTLHFDAVKFKIGGNFVNNRDEFSIFPDAELGLRVFGDGIQIFAGAGGDLRKNTYRSFTDYNPFIQIRGSKLRNTRYDTYYGGLRGNFGWLDYTAQASWSKASDLALYSVLVEDSITRFGVLYDTVKIGNLQGTVKCNILDGLTLTGTLSNNFIFDASNQDKPWGLPRLEGNFGAVYSALKGKASLRANAYVADGIWFKDVEGITRQSGVLFDLSLGGSYYFTKNIGVFLDLNNLLNNKRQRWFKYPTIGTNFMAGVTARF